jgi:hypothetical protein
MKHLILSLLVVGLSAAVASAGYINPPGWDTNPWFTHQSWSFDNDPGPVPNDQLPDDGGAGNPYTATGTPVGDLPEPLLQHTYGVWQDVLMQGLEDPLFQGGLVFPGTGEENHVMDVWIPNEAQPRPMFKQLWLQGIFITPNPQDPELDITVVTSDDVGREYETIWEEQTVIATGPIPGVGVGYAILYSGIMSGRWDDPYPWEGWHPQPPWEHIAFDFTCSAGNIIILDEFDCDTRCIPEPSTIAMLLGLTAMGLVAFMRRRK